MAGALMDPSLDELSYKIFSILESKFLFGYDAGSSPVTKTPAIAPAGKIRILSIDAGYGPTDGLLAGAALFRLESSLRRHSGDPDARIADFFDVAAGSGAGGVLAALLFTKGDDGRPISSAEEAIRILKIHRRKGIFRRIFGGGNLGRIFGDLTLRDSLKPLLIPCYDLATGAPFLFSRADAMETDGYDFRMRDVCAATCAGGRTVGVRSVDGRSRIVAVGGAVAMGNPTAAAITHVLNNRQEFPFATGVEDLMVVSIGGGEAAPPSAAELVRVAAESAADLVDQAVATAFGHKRTSSYVRIQADGLRGGKSCRSPATVMGQRNVESVLFEGKKISPERNEERLQRFSGDLVKEHQRRKMSPIPTVMIKQAMTPRTSSATTLTTITTTSTSPR